MAALYTNNASTVLASGITNSATSLTVQTGNGSKFPNPTGSDYFMCTLQGISGTPVEIVKVTARSTDTFTIVRAQEGTTASAFNANDIVELRVTAGEMTGLAITANPLSQFASTTSAQLASVLSDETGTGLAVFGTSPTIATPTITGNITDGTYITSVASTAQGTAKAWCSYNGNSQTILASYNISSVTYNTTGRYTFNFTIPMSSAFYSTVAIAGSLGQWAIMDGTYITNANQVSLVSYTTAGGAANNTPFNIAVFSN